MNSYYTVRIPVKPHIQKFFHSREGYPIRSSDQSISWLLIRPYLLYRRSDDRSPQQREKQIQALKASIIVQLPMHKVKLYGLSASPQGVILLNMLLDNLFGRELYWYVQANISGSGRYPGIKTAIEKFCAKHEIELEEDISLNTISTIYKRQAAREESKIKGENLRSPFAA